jgi:hypothetical protein
MSATHDSVFKTGTLCPGTLRFVFPHVTVAHASRRSSQPRRSRLHVSRVHVPHPQRFRAYRECFVARGFPGRTRLARPPASPAALAHEVRELGAAPRWSRPASPRRVNGVGSVDGPKHLLLLPCVDPLRLGRVRRSWPPISRPGCSSFRATAEALQCSLFNRPWVHSPLRSRPSRGRCPRSPFGAPHSGAVPRGPWFTAPEAPTAGFAEAPPLLDSPARRFPTPSSPRRDLREWAPRHLPTRSRPSRPARGRSSQVPSTIDTRPTGAELAPRTRRCTTCLCDRPSGTCFEATPCPFGSTLGGRRTPRRASQHPDGFCDRRLANSCSLFADAKAQPDNPLFVRCELPKTGFHLFLDGHSRPT